MSSRTTQWFVECDPVRNESLAQLLAAQGIATENQFVGVRDKDGRPHDVWCIPSSFVARLRDAKRVSSYYNFRFFVRDTPHSPIRPAAFLEKRRVPVRVEKALADLAKIRVKTTMVSK